jgi:hypothetical protein
MRRLQAASIVLVAVGLAPSPARAQADLTGSWGPRYHEDQPERIPGPELVNYLGLPINEAARQWALSWDPSRLTLEEHQCQVHVSPYIYRGPLQLRIWEERDPNTEALIAIKNYISTYEQTRTIWMDGRPHPPDYAAHTWQGFSTGTWEGDMLTVTTTHIKQGWIRRNGLPESDLATLTEHFIRHGEYLTHISVLTDPVYLTEPLVKSQNFVLNTRVLPSQAWLWPCEAVVEVANRPLGELEVEVPHYLPGQNPFLNEFSTQSGIPLEATLGGAETMYPEYMMKLRQMPPPKRAPK